MPRRLLHIPRHTLRVVLIVVVLGVLLFFAVTRTQVGRDRLHRQLERSFAEAFEGRLEIGRLTGNLAQSLFASDIRLYDAEDRLVLTIDSLVAHPRWRQLFSRRLAVRKLTLIRPSAQLVYRSDSTWNLASAFHRRTKKPPPERDPWRFESADLRIVDGTIRTHHMAVPPPSVMDGRVFNYADATLQHLHLRSTVEWNKASRFFDVLALSAEVPAIDLVLDDLRGQVQIDSSRVLVTEMAVQAGRTDLRLDLALGNLHRRRAEGLAAVTLDADVPPSRIDADLLRRIFPALPLADVLDVTAHVDGPLSGLVIEEVLVGRGRSRIQAAGTLLGLPDSLDFDVAFRESALAARDVQAVLPGLDLSDLTHLGLVDLDLETAGVVHRNRTRFHTHAEIDVRAPAGHVTGTLSLDRAPGQPDAFAFALDTDSLDLGRLTQNETLTGLLNGRVTARGQQLRLDSLHADVQLALGPSTLAGRQLDTLHVDGSVVDQQWEATLMARQGVGGLYGTTALDLRGARPRYRAGLVTRRLDLARALGGSAPASQLNGTWTLDGAGLTWPTAQGTLAVRLDASTMQYGDAEQDVPAQHVTLTVRPPSTDEPRLSLTGDALVAHLDGLDDPTTLAPLSALWRLAFAEAIQRQRDKTFTDASGPEPSRERGVVAPSLDLISQRERVRNLLNDAGLDAVALRLDLEVLRAGLLGPLLPATTPLATDAVADLTLAADADALHVQGHLTGTTLAGDDYAAHAFEVHLRADADLNAPLEETLTATLDVRADSLQRHAQTLRALRVTADVQDRSAHFDLATDRYRRAGPLHLAVRFDLLPDRNRLTLLDAQFALDTYVWTSPTHQIIDVYRQAIVVPGLRLESSADADETPQSLYVHGILSSAPQDTFYVEVEHVGLRRLSTSLGMRQTPGGLLNGRLALTNVARPELTGHVTVDDLALDDNLLGHLTLTSHYEPNQPDVALNLRLRPEEDAPDGLAVKESTLGLNGTFRLPGGDDPGALNLHLDAERADAFFLEYILNDIENASGALGGEGAIRGTFKKPLFEADMHLTDGRFDVPQFNLHYSAEGPVRVDDEAIHLDGVQLNDPTGGAAILSGAILFNDYKFLSFDLAAQLNDLQIIDVSNSRELPFYGDIWASGNVTLTGPLYSALLTSENAATSSQSEIFIPLSESETAVDPGFIVFTDSTGQIPDFTPPPRRENILARRPEGERSFVDGLEMDLNIFARQGSTVHLVIDPLLGDEINAVGSGRIQLQRVEGEFVTFGTLDVEGGDYLFTAGEVFVRRFLIEDGSITWDGDPLDARLDIDAAYRTRASRAGLPSDIADRLQPLIPLIVQLHITGRVSAPLVDLNLAVDRDRQEDVVGSQFLETYLNQPDRAAQHATSVLLTNSFLLTAEGTESDVLAGSAFNSVSQLVSSQLNRYLSRVVPNADFSFGVQSGETTQELDVTAGLAIRLLNERLVIRGQGVYRGLRPTDEVGATAQQGLQGEFVVEVRLNPNVSVEIFYRREGDVLSESLLTSTTGAGLSYRTEFSTWRRLFRRILGKTDDEAPADTSDTPVVEMRDDS